MPNSSKQQIGKRGEDIVANFLAQFGYSILTRNYFVRGGEIDIIAQNADALVFVEVKSTASKSFGEPETWVDERKQKRIGVAAERYLADNEIENVDCRFDVITVDLSSHPPRIHHIKDAFWLEE